MSHCKSCMFWKIEHGKGNKTYCSELNDLMSSEDNDRVVNGYSEKVLYLTGPMFGCVLGRDKITGESFNKPVVIVDKKQPLICEKHRYMLTGRKNIGYPIWRCAVCGDEKVSS